jgi:hypothetical protein
VLLALSPPLVVSLPRSDQPSSPRRVWNFPIRWSPLPLRRRCQLFHEARPGLRRMDFG